jgi:type IV secretory pathway VirB4 component
MYKVAFIIKGISGSGKSTRILFLLNQLKQEFKNCLFYYNDKLIGTLFEELNLLIIGKEQKSGLPFQGFDSVTGVFQKVENFSDFLKNNDFNVIIEGAGITDSYRFRPKFLREYCNFDLTLIQYYSFNKTQKQQYLERIERRTGKLPKSDVMFNKISNFEGDFNRSMKEASINDIVYYDNYDVFVDDFFVKFIDFMECVL